MPRNIKINLSGEVWNGVYPSGCFHWFSIPKTILAMYRSIKKIEFDCEMKKHCNQIYGDDELNKKALFSTETDLDKIILEPCFNNVTLFIFLNWSTNNSHHKLGCNKCISNTTYNWISVMKLNKLNEYFNNSLEVYSVIIKTQLWVSPAKNYYGMLIILQV